MPTADDGKTPKGFTRFVEIVHHIVVITSVVVMGKDSRNNHALE